MLPLNFEPINYWGFSIYHLNIFETSTISDYLNIPNLFLLPHFYLVKKPSVIHIPSILLYTLHACVWIIWRFLLSCRGYCYFKELVWVERIIKDRWFSIYCNSFFARLCFHCNANTYVLWRFRQNAGYTFFKQRLTTTGGHKQHWQYIMLLYLLR